MSVRARSQGVVPVVLGTRPREDWNTCGQAAIASVLARFQVGPFASGHRPSDGEAIDHVRRSFPPDLPFGLGTSASRIAAALRHHGLAVERVHSGWFGRRASAALRIVRSHLERDLPVIVCLDQGMLGGPAFSAHWALLLEAGSGAAQLAGCEPRTISLERFLSVWRCRHLPFSYNHTAILAAPSPAR